jgi:hypothetical protein
MLHQIPNRKGFKCANYFDYMIKVKIVGTFPTPTICLYSTHYLMTCKRIVNLIEYVFDIPMSLQIDEKSNNLNQKEILHDISNVSQTPMCSLFIELHKLYRLCKWLHKSA